MWFYLFFSGKWEWQIVGRRGWHHSSFSRPFGSWPWTCPSLHAAHPGLAHPGAALPTIGGVPLLTFLDWDVQSRQGGGLGCERETAIPVCVMTAARGEEWPLSCPTSFSLSYRRIPPNLFCESWLRVDVLWRIRRGQDHKKGCHHCTTEGGETRGSTHYSLLHTSPAFTETHRLFSAAYLQRKELTGLESV